MIIMRGTILIWMFLLLLLSCGAIVLNPNAVQMGLDRDGYYIFDSGITKIKNIVIPNGAIIEFRPGAIVEGKYPSDTLFRLQGSSFDIHVHGFGAIRNADVAFYHNGGSVVSGSSFEDISFTNIKKCFDIGGSIGVTYRMMKFQEVECGIVFRNEAATNINRIVSNKFLLFDTVAIEFKGGNGSSAGNIITKNWIEDSYGIGIFVKNNHNALTICMNYFETVGDSMGADIYISPIQSIRGLSVRDNQFSVPNDQQERRVYMSGIVTAILDGNYVMLKEGDVFTRLEVAGSGASGIIFKHVSLNAVGGGHYESRLYSSLSSTVDVSYKVLPNSGFVTNDEISRDVFFGLIEVN